MDETEDHMGDEALIAEYAMGLLSGEERRTLEDRLAAEPALRGLLADWQERLAAMVDEITPVAPAPAVFKAIETRLFGEPVRERGFFQRLFSASGIAGMVTSLAVLIGLMIWLPGQEPAGPLYTAELTAEGSDVVMSASYAEGGQVQLTRASGEAPSGRVLELWLILGEEAPISLGVWPGGDQMAVQLPPELVERVGPGAVLAFTDEPPGGAPGGIPTGQILAAAPLDAA